MIIHNKLVRDKIPEIIEASGKTPKTKILGEREFIDSLNLKLQEELKEYYESYSTEELADLIEIVYTILEHRGISLEEFEKIRLHKKETRGGFSKRLFLISVSD